VAARADGVLICSGTQIVVAEGAVRVVAIAALDEPFIHAMMEWHIESRLYIRVALIAELGLVGLE
jgi:hypothetical protein